MPKVGAHVSAAISLELAFERAQNIGAQCVQIFISPPQRWLQTKHDDAEIKKFLDAQKNTGIGPNFIHGTYLVSLGTEKPEHLQQSIEWLVWAMNMAGKLGIRGVIFHSGSHKGAGIDSVQKQIVETLKKVLSQSPENTFLILENSAGAGGSIGRDFHELGQILKEVGDKRLKVCMDTCHTFAAGYDLRTPLTLKDVLEEFDQEIGLENLVAIHANDSKFDLKMHKDRHENIGDGFIGREVFENLINHPALKEVPFLLEVPGFDDNGPDAENVKILKSLRA